MTIRILPMIHPWQSFFSQCGNHWAPNIGFCLADIPDMMWQLILDMLAALWQCLAQEAMFFSFFPSLVFSVHCNSNVAVWILLVCFFTGHLCNGELFRPCRCRKRKHLYQYHLITPTEGKGLCANKPLAWNNGWVWCHGVIVFGCALSPASPSSRPLPASHTAHC